MTDNLATRLAALPEARERGVWQRHVAVRHARHALGGRAAYGRWSTSDGFPVLYLGQPRDSVVIEAYRHLVDPTIFDDPADRLAFVEGLVPRVLVTCAVDVTQLLDLRTPLGRGQAGLTIQDLESPTTDRDAYRRCQRVAQVAHQLRRHGIIAPAATGVGYTLALFMDLLPAAEQPVRTREDEAWQRLPADPRSASTRRLRVVRDR